MRCAQATLCPESSRDQLEQVLCYHLTDTSSPPCCSTETPPSSCHDTPSCNDTPTKKSHFTVDLESCYYVYDYLKYGVLNPSTEDVAAFSAKCHAAFPLAAAFHQQEADVPRWARDMIHMSGDKPYPGSSCQSIYSIYLHFTKLLMSLNISRLPNVFILIICLEFNEVSTDLLYQIRGTKTGKIWGLFVLYQILVIFFYYSPVQQIGSLDTRKRVNLVSSKLSLV